jgi:hypothetical protein
VRESCCPSPRSKSATEDLIRRNQAWACSCCPADGPGVWARPLSLASSTLVDAPAVLHCVQAPGVPSRRWLPQFVRARLAVLRASSICSSSQAYRTESAFSEAFGTRFSKQSDYPRVHGSPREVLKEEETNNSKPTILRVGIAPYCRAVACATLRPSAGGGRRPIDSDSQGL